MSDPTFVQAAREALQAAMVADPRVVVLGEDVGGGGPFGLTKDLAVRFGAGRVRSTPISEGAVMGAGIGLALGGARPFVDLMFIDFLTAGSDQLCNHAAKIHFMSGGAYSVPLTVWTIGGAGTRWGAQHSQRLDGWLTATPGLKVLAPSSPAGAAAAIRAALSDPDPVVVIADRALLYTRTPVPDEVGSPWTARVVQRGGDLTIAATGRLVHIALDAAARTGHSVEVVDLRCLAPLDVETIAGSVRRTSRLLVLHDEPAPGVVAAQVATAVTEAAFWALDAPVARLVSPATPVPAAPALEDAHVIDAETVAGAIKRVLRP